MCRLIWLMLADQKLQPNSESLTDCQVVEKWEAAGLLCIQEEVEQ